LRSARCCTLTNLFPRRQRLEVSKSLCHLQRFVDDSLSLFVVPKFGVSGQGEVLAKWMTLKSVVGQYPAEIWMVFEKDTEKIPSFSLIPICSSEQGRSTGDIVCLPRIRLDSNPPRVFNTQHMIDYFESLVPLRKVNPTNVDDTLELTL